MQEKNEKVFVRNILGEYVSELGKEFDKLVVVNADLMGTSRNKSFAEKFSQRSFNVGIAEQNLVSFSAGLAYEGFIPLAFSMAPFLTMRACEQVRTDIAYNKANVKLIASYSGVSGGISGATHWAIEDCAIMTSMPGMTVIEPSDATQAKILLKQAVQKIGPVYFRTSVEAQQDIYGEKDAFEIGKAAIPIKGGDGAYICSGVTVQFAIEAALQIRREFNKKIRVVDMHTIKPIDRQAIIDAAKTGRIIVAQDHNIIGGLGFMVANILAEEKLAVNFKILGIKDKFVPMAHAPYLYHQFGYDADGLKNSMIELFKSNI